MKGNACGYVARTQSECGSVESNGERIKTLANGAALMAMPIGTGQRSMLRLSEKAKGLRQRLVPTCGATLLGMN